MMRIGLALLALLLLAGVGFYVLRDRVALALFQHAVDRGIAADTIDALPDGLTAGFCGTGSPLPDRTRAGPCTAVIAGKRLFIFDAGDGSAETLSLMGLSPARIEAVFLTHFHSDHIDGLGNLALQRWAQGAASTPLPLYGGEGVERVAAGFTEAYAQDSGYRIAHHGPRVVPPSGAGITPHAFALADGQASVVVLDDGGVRITAFPVDHGPVHPAFGYRIDYKGRSIVISGDTRPAPSLVHAAQNADLLVHEALSPELTGIMERAARAQHQDGVAKILHDILTYHTTPGEAAAEAEQAHVHALALTHLIPQMPTRLLEGPFLGDARQRFHGPLWIMRDGDLIELPATGGIKRRHTIE